MSTEQANEEIVREEKPNKNNDNKKHSSWAAESDDQEEDQSGSDDESDNGGWATKSSSNNNKKRKSSSSSGWGKKKPKNRELWKLVMMRKVMAITFRFGDRCSCAQLLFDDKEKQKEHRDGSVSTRIRLCEECVQLNIEANEAVGKFYEPKKGNGSWKKK